MLAQTNVQLYRYMIEHKFDEHCFLQVQKAYDIARSLFGSYSRPNRKPFVCHLVGTCSALIRWNQPIDLAIAGLLHSAYLYGNFQDGDRGATVRRRTWLQSQIGDQAEMSIFAYTEHRKTPLDINNSRCVSSCDSVMKAIDILKLADLLDELSDCGAMYTPNKKMDGIEIANASHQCRLVEFVESRIGPGAANDFRRLFEEMVLFPPLPCLIGVESSFGRNEHPIKTVSRSKVGRAFRRLSRKIFVDPAA